MSEDLEKYVSLTSPNSDKVSIVLTRYAIDSKGLSQVYFKDVSVKNEYVMVFWFLECSNLLKNEGSLVTTNVN